MPGGRLRNVACLQSRFKKNRLTAKQEEELKMLFVEGKWLYNAILNSGERGESILSYDTKSRVITHKDKDGRDVTGEFRFLPQSLRQTIHTQIKDSMRVLATRKKRGYKIGRLKYISSLGSLNFKQLGVTHKILGKNRIKLQGVKGALKVNGMDQFYGNPDYEIANARLLNKPDGYYIAITTYIDRNRISHRAKNDKVIGIDFGCRTSFVTSEGERISACVQESERMKRLQRKLAKQKKGSKRYMRTSHLIQVEYQKMDNRKNDLANKTIAHFRENRKIVIQDEMLPLWHRARHGKTLQHGILWRVKSGLMAHDDTIVLSRSLPTTKLCTHCGRLNPIFLSEKTYHCECMCAGEDRDVHAARNMVWFYVNNVGVGRTKIKRVELREAIDKAIADSVAEAAMKREAPTF